MRTFSRVHSQSPNFPFGSLFEVGQEFVLALRAAEYCLMHTTYMRIQNKQTEPLIRISARHPVAPPAAAARLPSDCRALHPPVEPLPIIRWSTQTHTHTHVHTNTQRNKCSLTDRQNLYHIRNHTDPIIRSNTSVYKRSPVSLDMRSILCAAIVDQHGHHENRAALGSMPQGSCSLAARRCGCVHGS